MNPSQDLCNRAVATGTPVGAAAALASGLVDALAEDPLTEAIARLNAGAVARRRLSTAPRPAPPPEVLDALRAQLAKRMSGQNAPGVALDLIGRSATGNFAEGIAAERAAFVTLRQGDQARALRHIFFAERAARKAGPKVSSLPPLARVAVVGGGTMGAGIAFACLRADLCVTLIEVDASAAEWAGATVAGLIEEGRARSKLDAEGAAALAARFTAQAGYAGLEDTDLAIEAVFEDLTVKQSVFRALEAALPEHAVIATNTSYLDVDAIAGVLADPTRALGLHFFSPAHLMRLLEIVRGARSSDAVLALGFDLARRMDKIPVLSGVCDGFIGNRILARMRHTAERVLMRGASPSEVDTALQGFGFAMGPFAVQDMAGLQIALATRVRQDQAGRQGAAYCGVFERLVAEGRLGQRTNMGWYDYEGGKRRPSARCAEILAEERARIALPARAMPPEAIAAVVLAAMADEARAILNEGIASSGSEIDLVEVHGYGFPRVRGGHRIFGDGGLAIIFGRVEDRGRGAPRWDRCPETFLSAIMLAQNGIVLH